MKGRKKEDANGKKEKKGKRGKEKGKMITPDQSLGYESCNSIP